MVTVLTAAEPHYYTPEEYLSLEETAEYKSEYRDGKIIPMTGGTINHNRIIGNLHTGLKLALKGQDYEVFFSDVRLWIPETRLYTYPDVMVISGQPEYYADREDTITNARVIIEVLSKSTQAYDRGEKFSAYKTIATFQEYILVEQDRMAIEQYSKQANKRWYYREYDAEDPALVFSSFAVEIPLIDIYEKVVFTREKTQESSEDRSE